MPAKWSMTITFGRCGWKKNRGEHPGFEAGIVAVAWTAGDLIRTNRAMMHRAAEQYALELRQRTPVDQRQTQLFEAVP